MPTAVWAGGLKLCKIGFQISMAWDAFLFALVANNGCQCPQILRQHYKSLRIALDPIWWYKVYDKVNLHSVEALGSGLYKD
jgi:hypothetical protein